MHMSTAEGRPDCCHFKLSNKSNLATAVRNAKLGGRECWETVFLKRKFEETESVEKSFEKQSLKINWRIECRRNTVKGIPSAGSGTVEKNEKTS